MRCAWPRSRSPTTSACRSPASRCCRRRSRLAEQPLELAPQHPVDLRHRNDDAEIGEAGDALSTHSARDDAGIVLEIRIDVERDAVKRHPASDADADGGDLVRAA